MAQSKRKLVAATALFIAVGALTGAIATGGAVTASFAQTQGQDGGGGASGGQQGEQVRIVRQGTITSETVPLPGFEGQQRATILPLREDGSIYSGVLTFTASEPVNVVVLNVQNLNETEQAILNATDDEDGGQFGQLLTAALDNQTRLALTVVAPNYGASPVPSASLAFTGNALWLHTAEDTPFVANYAVSAQTATPEMMNEVRNATLAVAEDEDAAAEDEDAAAAAEDEDAAAAAEDEDAAAEDEDAADAGTNATDTAEAEA